MFAAVKQGREAPFTTSSPRSRTLTQEELAKAKKRDAYSLCRMVVWSKSPKSELLRVSARHYSIPTVLLISYLYVAGALSFDLILVRRWCSASPLIRTMWLVAL